MKKLLAQHINSIKVTAAQVQTGSTRIEGADIRFGKDLSELSDGLTAVVTPPKGNAPRTVGIRILPKEGVYSAGTFDFTLTIDSEYPIEPPKVMYVGPKIFHPNIDDQGGVCLNILKPPDWKPVLGISHIIFGLELLFIEPNPDDPLPGTSREAAVMMKDDRKAFVRKAQEWMHLGGCYHHEEGAATARGSGGKRTRSDAVIETSKRRS